MPVDGLITIRSERGPADTMRRLESEVHDRGLTVFAHIDHAAGAAAAGMALRPTDLLIFGAARGGTPLMQAAQTAGIDLPLKALVWQDAAGATFVSYDDPSYIGRRHGLGAPTEAAIARISAALREIATRAADAPDDPRH